MPRQKPTTPGKASPACRTRLTGKKEGSQATTPKQALAAALEHLGPEATSRDIAGFMREHFGIEFTFVLVTPKRQRRENATKRKRPRAA